jgi:chorismate-pyruvate lyase
LAALNAALLADASATRTLERWCVSELGLAPQPVRVEKQHGALVPASADCRQRLGARSDEALRFRRVRVCLGALVLSRADNWYRPDRLSDKMNRQLTDSDIPFGQVILPLGYCRQTLSVTLWPEDADAILRHHALLLLPDGRPLAEVVERYAPVLLGQAGGPAAPGR